MNGFITRAVAMACLGATFAGCKLYDKYVDPCYPERYNYQARGSVDQAFATQAFNGHVLDQTIWDYFFVPGTENLTQGGRVYLAHLARVRPQPDPKIFLQTAQDVAYDQKAPEKMVNARRVLNEKRVEAIHKYLQAQTADRPVPWEIAIHDPGEQGLSAVMVGGMSRFSLGTRVPGIIDQWYLSPRGSLPGQGATVTSSGGGGSGGGGASGGGAGGAGVGPGVGR